MPGKRKTAKTQVAIARKTRKVMSRAVHDIAEERSDIWHVTGQQYMKKPTINLMHKALPIAIRVQGMGVIYSSKDRVMQITSEKPFAVV
jgi:hypothetical protein